MNIKINNNKLKNRDIFKDEIRPILRTDWQVKIVKQVNIVGEQNSKVNEEDEACIINCYLNSLKPDINDL